MKRALAAGCLSAALLLLPPAELHAQASFETTRIAEGVYRYRWQNHNALLVTTPAGVVVFDPINTEAARQFSREIRTIAPGSTLAAIVYSHSDTDHATGATTLMAEMGQTGVPIIAHENALTVIRERGTADQPVPTVTFAERMSFEVGGRRIELHYVGNGHTDNSIVSFIPDAGVAFAVDFVANDRVGFQGLEGWYFPDFFDGVAAVLRIPFETMVFGHGNPGNRATVQRQITYYDDLTAAVRRARAQGLTEDQAAERIRLPQYAAWEQYDAWLPLNVRAIHRWLASEDN